MKDLEGLAHIHSAALIEAYEDTFDEVVLKAFSFDSRKKGFAKELTEGYPETAIISVDQQPVGLLSFGKSRYQELGDEYIEIWRVYVHPSHWNKGIGSLLLNWGVKELKSRGHAKIALWVLEENLSARGFYEKNGFYSNGTLKSTSLEGGVKELLYIKKF